MRERTGSEIDALDEALDDFFARHRFVPCRKSCGHAHFREQFVEDLYARFQFTRKRMQNERQVARARRFGTGDVGVADFFDELFRRQAEVFGNAYADFVTGKGFAACPVINAAQVRALAELDEYVCKIADADGLADFFAEERRLLACRPIGEKAFVQTAGAREGIAGNEGRTNDACRGFPVFQDFAFAHELGLRIEVARERHVGVFVVALVAVKNHIGRNVDEASGDVVGKHGEAAREGDVDAFGAGGVGRGVGNGGHRGAVDNRVGEFLENLRFERVGVFQIRFQTAHLRRKDRFGFMQNGCYVEASTQCRKNSFPPQKSGGSGNKHFHWYKAKFFLPRTQACR